MAIAPIPPISLPGLGSIAGSTAVSTPGVATGAAEAGGGGFAGSLSNALESLADAHAEVDDLAVQAATGDLTAIHDYTIATSEVQLMTQLTVEVRNKAIEAFNDVMRMQV